MKHISNILEGKATSRNSTISEELTADDMAHMKSAPMTSVDVERSFSRYKTILADNRGRFLFDNIKQHLTIQCYETKGKASGLLRPLPIESGKPLPRLTFDYLGPLPPSHRKKYLIVATCNATKMAFVANPTGAETKNFLMDLITYGVPKYFCSDRGTHFKNKEVEEVCKNLKYVSIHDIVTNMWQNNGRGKTKHNSILRSIF
ncbi:uncharacterized protein LOC111027727 [Myzus persicae]|uniref:uncharacterized protein LOC111027727 n=1 Tax=Myzus persicae TaxID=13164 RepID=UPI000B933E77|nr:uncharacterized protein LOC111027727 [Myzus persicae]